MKFRKKPIVVEAVQLLWSTWSEMCEHAGVGLLTDGKPEGCYIEEDGHYGDGLGSPRPPRAKLGLRIPTLEGIMLGVEGDWIIKGVNREIYPCKPDIFEKIYERVE